MSASRRNVLQTAASLLAMPLPSWQPQLAFAPKHTAPRGDVLVCVFLRGAADVLNMVVPHAEAEYYRQRPTLAIPRPDDRRVPAGLRAHDLDGFFGLHPQLSALLPAWQARQLAIVHACGAPDQSRSHFQAMELIERGVNAATGPASGWIGRHLASLDTANHSPLRAIGLGERVQRSLQGPIPTAALRSIADFHLGGQLPIGLQLQSALTSLYQNDDLLAEQAQGTLETLNILQKLDPTRYQPIANASYPIGDFGMGLRQVAMLVKADVGLEVACIDLGGWDTHINQGASEGWLATLLAELSSGLSALYSDLRDHMGQLLVVVMSEFGRRLEENGGFGTDHGHGSMMILMGGAVQGGRVHGVWPGLAAEQLVGPSDLAVTTDYRDILGELVQRRLNNPQLAAVFPGYTPTFRGIVGDRMPS